MLHVHRQAPAAPRSAMSRALDCVVGPEWAAAAGGIATGHLEVGDTLGRPHSYAHALALPPPPLATAAAATQQCRTLLPPSRPRWRAPICGARWPCWRSCCTRTPTSTAARNTFSACRRCAGMGGLGGEGQLARLGMRLAACWCRHAVAMPPHPTRLISTPPSGAPHVEAAARHAAGSPCSRAARCTRGCQAARGAAHRQRAHGLWVSRVQLLTPCC